MKGERDRRCKKKSFGLMGDDGGLVSVCGVGGGPGYSGEADGEGEGGGGSDLVLVPVHPMIRGRERRRSFSVK